MARTKVLDTLAAVMHGRSSSLRRVGWLIAFLLAIAALVWVEPSAEDGRLGARVRDPSELAAWWRGLVSDEDPNAETRRRRSTTESSDTEQREAEEELTWKDRRALDRLIEETTRD